MTEKDRFRIGMQLVKKLADVAANPEAHTEFLENVKENGDFEDIIGLSTEMLNLVEHVQKGGSIQSYESNFILWNDATVSGAQNLAMLTKDPVTLALVNGLDTYQKRDLYIKVGERAFKDVQTEIDALKAEGVDMKWTDEDTVLFNSINEQLAEILRERDSPFVFKDDDIADLEAKYLEIVRSPQYTQLALKYWSNPSRQGKVRSLAKGPVMTGFYSAGPWGMAEDMVKDFGGEGAFKDLNQGLAVFLTSRMKEATKKIAPGPRLAQTVFTDIVNKMPEGEFLQLNGLINGFPFLHKYVYYKELVNAKTKKRIDTSVKVPNPGSSSLRADGKEFSLTVRMGRPEVAYTKARVASAPNITHWLDGQIVASQFTDEVSASRRTATIHDNFGTHPSDADAQVQSVKDAMADMYQGDTMEKIIRMAFETI